MPVAPSLDGPTGTEGNLNHGTDLTSARPRGANARDNGRMSKHARPDPTGFPLLLDLTGRRVVVVGGGSVAARRARSLHEAGADVMVVAPSISAAVTALGVATVQRAFRPGDLDGAWLAMACTDDPE